MSRLGTEEVLPTLVGKKLASVSLSADKAKITLAFEDGTAKAFGVEGDCCSNSWIEHLEMPADVAGATILAVEDSDEVDATDDESKNPKSADPDAYREREHESLTVYNTRFRTDRGDIVLEYRNSSNGYYGGYLVEVTP